MVLMQSLKLGEYFHMLLIYKADDVLSKAAVWGEREKCSGSGDCSLFILAMSSALHSRPHLLASLSFPFLSLHLIIDV